MASLTANRGLVTQPSELTRPDGSLEVADNVVIDSDNVIEQRRGFGEFGNETPNEELIKQLMIYKGRVLRHYADKIAFDSDGNGTFVEFDGSYMELATKLRIKFIESNGNLYFTTTEGIKKISALSASDLTSATGYITDAGGVKAVGLQAKIMPNVAGWLPAQSKVGYKVVWSIKDANSNVITGVPSSRVVVSNTSQDVNVGERFTIAVLVHSSIGSSEYITFDTPTGNYALWFKTTGSSTAPIAAELVTRTLYEVDIQGLGTNDLVAAKIASVLSAIADITVEVSTNEVTVTNVDGGDVLDASNGTVDPSHLLVSTIYDGQTATGTPANVQLTFTVPAGVTSDLYYYEIFRTGIVTVSTGVTLSDLDPGDEHQKVYESGVTQAEITAGVVTVEDITPDTFREGGAYLYTNPVTGTGILSANETPPIAKDIALFKGSVFYANTKERHRKQVNLLSVSDFVSGSSKIIIGNSTTSRSYTFRGTAEVSDITVTPKSTTLGNEYAIVYSARDSLKYKLWIDKGVITHSFDSTTAVDDATETITITDHGFAEGEKVVISGTPPTGLTAGNTYYVKNRTTNTFQLSSSFGGSVINLTDAVGTCTITHTPEEPTVADSISLRVALQTYPDTLQGSTDALIDAFFDISDFEAVDQGSGLVRIFNTDNGESTDISSSANFTWTEATNTQGTGEDSANGYILLSGLSSVGQSVEDTARSLERVINDDANSPVNAFYLSGQTDLPGILLLEARELTDDAFYVAVNSSTIADKWNPIMPVSATITDIEISGNLFTTSSAHGLVAGDSVFISDNLGGTPNYLSGKYTVATTPSATEFTLTGVTITVDQLGIAGVVYKTDVASDNSINPNRVYFSKLFQPEAVPLVNYIDIGPKDKAIQRILALRDSLIVLKEDGIYVITGSQAPDFYVRLADSSAITIAPDTAANLNNLIYVLTTQGVVTVSETGVGVISRNIENKVKEVTNGKYDYKLTSFGVASESDRSYMIWLPTKTSDSVATQAFRYNTFTRAWTRWTKPANCGLVNPADDKIYLGDASGRDFVLQERKNFERQDYADRDFELLFPALFMSNNSLTVSLASELEIGDSITQDQYVDVNKFNRLLKKLDRDTGVASSDYFTSLEISSGENMADYVDDLRSKLISDGIAVPATVGTNTAEQIRDDYNTIIDYLNDPLSGTSSKDYKTAEDLLVYEALITGVNISTNVITVNFSGGFLVGSFTAYKAIKTKVQYAPQHFGKPEVTKQIPEGTFIFDQNNFWGGTVGYASDRSYDFATVNFVGRGPGFWDGYTWAEAVYGGDGNEVPVRTLVPISKARCRYLHVQFSHTNAREKWRLLGVSVEPREVSQRGYR